MQNDSPSPALDAGPFDPVLGKCLRVGVIVVKGSKISAMNATAQEMLGVSEAATGQPLEFLSPSVCEFMQQALPGNQKCGQVTVKQKGAPATMLNVTAQIFQKKPPGIVALLQDATAEEDLSAGLQKLNRLASVGTFSAGMAHEIKNALVPVRTFLEVIMQQNQGMELAAVVDRETRRIDSLVSQMLKFAGPAKPTFTAIHLHDVLEHCARLLHTQMLVKGVSLDRSLTAQPDWVRGDSYQLEQVFTNVLINALEAMPFGGKIYISTELIGGSHEPSSTITPAVQVSIRDTGIGIAPEHLKRLFDTFFTTKPAGTGLGLTITRRILKEHNGSIEAQSKQNQGSTFIITLPALTEGTC